MLYVGRKDCGLKLRELGEAMGGIDYVSVGAAVKRFEQRLAREAALAAKLPQLQQVLQM